MVNKNLTTITINNYNGKKIIYTMPPTALINRSESTMITGKNAGKTVEFCIDVRCRDGIEVQEEVTD